MLLIAASAGTLFYFLLQAITPLMRSISLLHPGLDAPKGHPVFALMFRLQGLLANPLMQPFYLAFFVIITIHRRAKPEARITAFMAGLSLPFIVFHLAGLL